MLKDSPYFYFSNGTLEAAFSVLNDLLGGNKCVVTKEIKSAIIAETVENKESLNTSLVSLYSNKYISMTFLLKIMSFGYFFVISGVINCLPNVAGDKEEMQSKNKSDQIIAAILLACVLEIPSVLASGFIPNIRLIGRKTFLQITTAIMGICFFAALMENKHTVSILSAGKTMANIAFYVTVLITSESYPPEIKTKAVGLVFLSGRVGNITGVIVDEFFVVNDKIVPIWLFAFCSWFVYNLVNWLPKDKR